MLATQMTNRKRFQFSLLTALAMMIAAGGLIGLNVREKTYFERWSRFDSREIRAGRCVGCGWPLNVFVTISFIGVPANFNGSTNIGEFDASQYESIRWPQLLIDVFSAWVILAFIYFACQRWSGISD